MQNRIKRVFLWKNLTLGSASRYSQNQTEKKEREKIGFASMLTPFVYHFVRFQSSEEPKDVILKLSKDKPYNNIYSKIMESLSCYRGDILRGID